MSTEEITRGGIDRDKHGLCLLSLDGGGVRGLSTLYILRGLMKSINSNRKAKLLAPVKPCQVFDLIGGTSTGGLIAIMLGRLEMDVEACIKAYIDMMEDVFGRRTNPIDWKLNVKGQFDAKRLEKAVKSLVPQSEDPETALLNDGGSDKRPCRAFVCAVRKTNKTLARFRTYDCDALMDEGEVTVWQAARATSAATSFFDPITIGEGYSGRQYVDGAFGFNNPLDEVWLEALDIWKPDQGRLEQMLKCVVSIGTGNPGTSSIEDKPWSIATALKEIATETENTERVFAQKHHNLLRPERRYFRFNVDQGLQDVGLEEYKRGDEIFATTAAYLNDHQLTRIAFQDCAAILSQKEFWFGKDADYQKLIALFPDLSLSSFTIPFYIMDVPEVDYFVGRTSALLSIEQALLPFDTAKRRKVVLHGLGGMGKTQLAIHYASKFQKHYTAILWFNAKDEDSLRQSFVMNAKRLPDGAISEDLLKNEQDLSSLEKLIQAVKRWLALPRNDKWLLIFDNVDNPKIPQNRDPSAYDIRPYFPEAPQGSIIVTTRWECFSIGKLLEVPKLLEHKDCVGILTETSRRADLGDDADIGELLKRLDGLPLALATAGSYLSLETITVSEYIQRYDESWADLQRTSPGLLSYKDRTLYSTWNLSYRHICQQDEAAARLLKFLAYFDNQDVWYELFAAKRIGDHRPNWLDQVTRSGLVFDAAMRTLRDHGLVHALKDPRGYGMHGCVHSWTANVLNEQNDSHWTTALCCVGSLVPVKKAVCDSALRRRLLPHANRFLHRLIDENYSGTESTRIVVTLASHCLGILFSELEKSVEAESLYQRALVGNEKALGPDHLSTLNTVNSLGILYQAQGKIVEAKAMFQRAVAGMEKTLGPDHTSTLDMVNNLGYLYSYQGKLVEAEAMYQRALPGFEKALGPDHISTLYTVNNLGILYRDQGKLVEADAMFQRALAGKERAFGPDHTSTLETVNNLGGLYQTQGKMVESEAMYQRALAGYEKVLGPDYTSTLLTVNNLGTIYNTQGKVVEAEAMYRRALAGKERVLGPDHISTLETLDNLGIFHQDQGKLVEAEAMYHRVLAGREKVLGPEHTSTLQTVNSLGNVYNIQGKATEADLLYRRALAGFEKALGSDHTSTLCTVNNLGILHQSQGKLVEAESMLQQVLAGYEKALGPDHTSTLDTANNLGGLYYTQGKRVEAEAMYQRALAGYEKALGPDHKSTLDTANNLGLLYHQSKEHEKSKMYFERAWRGYAATRGADDPKTVDAQTRMEEAVKLKARNGQPVELSQLRASDKQTGSKVSRANDAGRWSKDIVGLDEVKGKIGTIAPTET
ncbi:MAG: hypothetical protein M1823_004424 [Watsoniomyces obsoletus]|nr:MAG: hypothetical protein M1823_004424 [Watsoniomyces obsoletus]